MLAELIASLGTALNSYGNLPVEVSVDLSTGKSDHGHRAFGSVWAVTTQAEVTPRSIVLCAEGGTLNFSPQKPLRLTKKKPTVPGWYWFKRGGSNKGSLSLARVYRRGKKLYYHVGEWPGAAFADDWDMELTSPQLRWSDGPVPEPRRSR